MKLLLLLTSLLVLSACAATDQKTLSASDQAVLDNELFDGELRSSSISKEKLSQSKSGTNFDETDTATLTESERAKFKKQQFIKKGEEALQSGNFELALYSYIRALIEDKQDKTLYLKIGKLHESKENSNLAGLAYKKALSIDANYTEALERLGRIELNERNYSSAEHLFERATKEDQHRLKEKATTENPQGKVDSSSPYYAYNGLGVIKDLQGKHDEALRYFQSALSIRPNSAAAENNLGYSFYLNNKLLEAKKHFKGSISKDRNYAKSWNNLALIHVRENDFQKAIQLLIDHTDNEPSAYNTVGYICMLEGKYNEAEIFFNKAIDLSPTYFEIAVENRSLNRRKYSSTVYESLN